MSDIADLAVLLLVRQRQRRGEVHVHAHVGGLAVADLGIEFGQFLCQRLFTFGSSRSTLATFWNSASSRAAVLPQPVKFLVERLFAFGHVRLNIGYLLLQHFFALVEIVLALFEDKQHFLQGAFGHVQAGTDENVAQRFELVRRGFGLGSTTELCPTGAGSASMTSLSCPLAAVFFFRFSFFIC